MKIALINELSHITLIVKHKKIRKIYIHSICYWPLKILFIFYHNYISVVAVLVLCLRYTYNTSVLLVTFTVYPDLRKSVSSWSGVLLLRVGWGRQTFIFLYRLSSLSFTRTYFPIYSLFPLKRKVASLSLQYRYFYAGMFRSAILFRSISADLNVDRVESPEFSPYSIHKRDSFPKYSLSHFLFS